MKTKSKRFLNLATLCLALLGTALLMGHPVKAETEIGVQSISRDTDTDQKDIIKERYAGQMGVSPDVLEQPDYKNRFEGYYKGYNDGLNGLERPERDKIEVPSEYNDDHGGEYKDGYQGGFEEGRREARPIAAFFEAVWQVLTDIFGGWFGSNNSSQS
ncbi:TPA: hypothetical protein VB452_001302 [Streptococcus pyogenes]|nr:hypothetical protein [Streptococcus pyogenes]